MNINVEQMKPQKLCYSRCYEKVEGYSQEIIVYEYFNADESMLKRKTDDAFNRQFRLSEVTEKFLADNKNIEPSVAAGIAKEILTSWFEYQTNTYIVDNKRSKIGTFEVPEKYLQSDFWEEYVHCFQRDYYAGDQILEIKEYHDKFLCMVLHFANRWSSLIREYLSKENVDVTTQAELLRNFLSYVVLINRRRTFGFAWYTKSMTDQRLQQGLRYPRGTLNPLLNVDGSISKTVSGVEEFVLVRPEVVVDPLQYDIKPDETDKLIYKDIIDHCKADGIEVDEQWTMVRASFNTKLNTEIRCYGFSGMGKKPCHKIPSVWWNAKGKSKYYIENKKEIFIIDKDAPHFCQYLITELFKTMRSEIERNLWKIAEYSAFEDYETANGIIEHCRYDLMTVDYFGFYYECIEKICIRKVFLKAIATPILFPIEYKNVERDLNICSKNKQFKPSIDFLNIDRLDKDTKELYRLNSHGWNEAVQADAIADYRNKLYAITASCLIEVTEWYFARQENKLLNQIIEIKIKNIDVQAIKSLKKCISDSFKSSKFQLIKAIKNQSDERTRKELLQDMKRILIGIKTIKTVEELTRITKEVAPTLVKITKFHWAELKIDELFEEVKTMIEEATKLNLDKQMRNKLIEEKIKPILVGNHKASRDKLINKIELNTVEIKRVISTMNLDSKIPKEVCDKGKNKLIEMVQQSFNKKERTELINVITEIKLKQNTPVQITLFPNFVKGELPMDLFFSEVKEKLLDIYTEKLTELKAELKKFITDYVNYLDDKIKKHTCAEDNVLTGLLHHYLKNVKIFNLSPVTFVPLDGYTLDDGKPFCTVCELKVKFYGILPFLLQELGMKKVCDDKDYVEVLNNLLKKMNGEQ